MASEFEKQPHHTSEEDARSNNQIEGREKHNLSNADSNNNQDEAAKLHTKRTTMAPDVPLQAKLDLSLDELIGNRNQHTASSGSGGRRAKSESYQSGERLRRRGLGPRLDGGHVSLQHQPGVKRRRGDGGRYQTQGSRQQPGYRGNGFRAGGPSIEGSPPPPHQPPGVLEAPSPGAWTGGWAGPQRGGYMPPPGAPYGTYAHPMGMIAGRQPLVPQQPTPKMLPSEAALLSTDVVYNEEGDVLVRLKQTDVLIAKAKTGDLILNSGGYRTFLTKTVLNQALQPVGLWIEEVARKPDQAKTVSSVEPIAADAMMPEDGQPMPESAMSPPSRGGVEWNVSDGRAYLATFQDGMVIKQAGSFSKAQCVARGSVIMQYLKQQKANAQRQQSRTSAALQQHHQGGSRQGIRPRSLGARGTRRGGTHRRSAEKPQTQAEEVGGCPPEKTEQPAGNIKSEDYAGLDEAMQ